MKRAKSRRPVLILVVTAVVVALGAGFWWQSRHSMDYMSDVSQTTTKSSTKDIKIVNFNYTPSEDRVKVGTTITWTNQDVTPHTVTGDWGTSQLFGKGQYYSHTFDKVGTYDYYCQPHPYMKGVIIVEP